MAGYVSDQERQLVERAEAIGPRALRLAKAALEQPAGDPLTEVAEIGRLDERQALVERRRELLAIRMELVEEREEVFGRRHEAVDRAEGHMAELEQRLLARSQEVGDTLRKLITAAADLQGEEIDVEEDDEPALAADDEPPAVPAPDDAVSTRPAKAGRARAKGPRRRSDRVAARTTQFRITLEAALGDGEPHYFYRYADDAEGALPGLFVVTPNLLKEDREVRVVMDLGGQARVEAKGVVAWRQRADEGTGPAGMGIELTSVEGDGAAVDAWLAAHPPVDA